MKKLPLFATLLVLTVFVRVHTASAHQPVYADQQTSISVPDADTSRAYYAELAGTPAVYTITSDKEFSLYLNILSPVLPDARKDFTVTITNESGTVATLSAPSSEWLEWHEEFAGDTYWKGPEFKQSVPAGTYTITVSNPGNTGKYVLAPGEAEVFTFGGTPATIHEIYTVKTRFFEKPWYSIFEGLIGKSLLVVTILVAVVLAAVVWLLVRRKKSA